jgi:hypothetical protein
LHTLGLLEFNRSRFISYFKRIFERDFFSGNNVLFTVVPGVLRAVKSVPQAWAAVVTAQVFRSPLMQA